MKSNIIDLSDILCEIADEAGFIVGVEVDDITNSTISDCWGEYWDIVFPTPIVNTLFVVDLFSHSVNNFTR